MFFADLENFRGSLKIINKNRKIDYNKVHFGLTEGIVKQLKWDKYNPLLIRGYFYTGVYTPQLISRIKNHKNKIKFFKTSEDNKIKISKKIEQCLETSKQRKKEQDIEFQNDATCPFIEFKKLPLQFSRSSIIVHQKGVDVQLAVDLVSHAYQNNYDVAVLCSGDMDLIESLKIIKRLGKKVIIVSHPNNVAQQMLSECDYFYDLSKLNENELNGFSNISNTNLEQFSSKNNYFKTQKSQ
jgi:uncharacterized LabA/DUF88 family protein